MTQKQHHGPRSPKGKRALHKRLGSARGLLIEWRNILRRSGPTTEDERLGFEREMARFDEAIKAIAEARDAAAGHGAGAD